MKAECVRPVICIGTVNGQVNEPERLNGHYQSISYHLLNNFRRKLQSLVETEIFIIIICITEMNVAPQWAAPSPRRYKLSLLSNVESVSLN